MLYFGQHLKVKNMEFTNEEIELVLTLLTCEIKKHSNGKVYFSPETRKNTESAYRKFIQILAASDSERLQENGYCCNSCQCLTPENELDTNNGICNECVVAERNDK